MTKLTVPLCLLSMISACDAECVLGIKSDKECNPSPSPNLGALTLKNKTSWNIDRISTGDCPACGDQNSFTVVKPDEYIGFSQIPAPPDYAKTISVTFDTSVNYGLFDYYIQMIPNTNTFADLHEDGTATVTYPYYTPPSNGGGGTSGGTKDCAGASTGPCFALANQCSTCGSGTGCQAPCYCAAACVCYQCTDSCEEANLKYASDLGTTCDYPK